MIRRLQWKMIAAIMLVVTLIIGVVCAVFYTMTCDNFRRAGEEMLLRALNMDSIRIAGPEDRQPEDNIGLPYFLIITDSDGSVRQTMGDSFRFSVSQQTLIQAVLEQPDDLGELKTYNLRYLRQKTEDGWRIACHDLSFERRLKLSTLAVSAGIGVGAIALFFVLSLVFARWAVGPVEQAWNRQKQFVADASHEMKTPLTVILSNADLLARQNEAGCALSARRLENIRAEGGRMRNLVENMLFLARSDAEIKAEPRRSVDWSDETERSVLTFEALAFEHGLEIDSRIEPGCVVLSTPDELRRLCAILLDNAVKYALPGGSICVCLRREQGRYAVLSVSNPSAPITSEQAGKLFDRFFRLDAARTKQSGYGLGLSIARSVTENAKGRIWVTHHDGVTTFFIRLPLEK